MGQLKKLKPDELKEEFDKCVEKVERFIPMNLELEASGKITPGINLQAEVFKKQKITDVPDVTKDESKNKSESAKSDTEEDVEAYIDERVDEPSLEELMMLKYGDNRPEEEYERVLWGDLKTMFDPPSTEDTVWSLTHQQKEAHNEDTQRNLKFTSEDQVRGGLLGIIVNRLKSGSYRVKSGRHS
ncbi:hypothetical protein Tco_1055362 [Tanacetum coccineum]|uniref:Uncharacterized protein n=1 Tax=Tanacetum coccineum TaxID=301880 RepID=A0ABQ5GZF7_9ASTR